MYFPSEVIIILLQLFFLSSFHIFFNSHTFTIPTATPFISMFLQAAAGIRTGIRAAHKAFQHRQPTTTTTIFSSSFSTHPDEPASANTWIDSEKVVVFGKTWCGFSTMATTMFQKMNVDYVSVDLDTRSDGAAIQAELAEMTGMSTVPSVWIDGNFIGGYSELSGIPRKELQSMLDRASK